MPEMRRQGPLRALRPAPDSGTSAATETRTATDALLIILATRLIQGEGTLPQEATTMNAPQLSYGKNHRGQDCWKLYRTQGNTCVLLEIRYYFGDPGNEPNHYRILAADDADGVGGYREVLTFAELDQRLQTITENEDEAAAAAWEARLNDAYMLSTPSILEIADDLKRRWEAMLTLGIFQPSITM